jgi:predicted nucleotidyltransferase
MPIADEAALPESHRRDIERAVTILREGGCSEVLLFGSAAEGRLRPESDLDIAVRGCPPGSFFVLLGRLLRELDHPVDLVTLDGEDPFGQHLQKEGRLAPVG